MNENITYCFPYISIQMVILLAACPGVLRP